MIFFLLLMASAILFFSALLTSARKAAVQGQAVAEGAQVPLVHVEAPAGFVAPITVTICDVTGRSLRVKIDEYGRQHDENRSGSIKLQRVNSAGGSFRR